MNRRVLGPLPALLALTACEPGLKIAPPPEQLETLDVAFSDGVSAGRREGELLVVGGPEDYAFVLTEEDGTELAFEVHSSGGFDLAHLSGPGRTLDLLGGAVPGHQSMVVSDESGPLWAADLGDRAAAVALLLDGVPVLPGETVYTDQDETWIWSYTTQRLSTDDGEIELLPGELETVVVAGRLWRFAPVAAYERRLRSGAELPDCSHLRDMLAYEMFRVEVALEPALRERAEGEPPAELGCEA